MSTGGRGVAFDIGQTWANLAEGYNQKTPHEHWGMVQDKIWRDRRSRQQASDPCAW